MVRIVHRALPPTDPNARTEEGTPQEQTVVSVIVPVWRERTELVECLRVFLEWPEVKEVIVAAAEVPAPALRSYEAAGLKCVSCDLASRGAQMNAGAAHATGEWLLFHHADTELMRPHVQALARLTASPNVGGAYYRKFDERHPWLRWAEGIERWHNRSFGPLFGDQSLFVRRAHFQLLGGYQDIPLLEDVEFSRRLRRSGKIALLDPPIATSPRKHLQNGPWKTTLQNASILFLYKMGVAPSRLHAWYYRKRSTPNA